MSRFTYFHNPKCNTSRKVLSHLESLSLDFQIRDYIQFSFSQLEMEELIKKLNVPISEYIRKKEVSEYDLFLSESSDLSYISKQIIRFPRILQRPIISYESHAFICRPYEKVLTLFNGSI